MPPQQGQPPYPVDHRPHTEEVSRSGVLFLLTVLALLSAVLFILCDWRINGSIVWSGYASGGVALLYILVALPLWFRRPNPVIFVPMILRVEDLMPILGIGRNTAYELIRSGQIRSVRIGRQIRIPREALLEFLRK